MADFKTSYRRTARHEGGYQNNPDDPGNYNSRGQNVGTKYGVSAPKLERLIRRPPTVADMLSLTPQQAEDAFRNDEWTRMKGDQIPWQPVADIIFDGLVNHGQGTRLLQEVLGIPTDNKFGPQTLAAVLASDPQQLYDAYRERRKKYYHQLVERDPTLDTFLNGWLHRINSFTDRFANAVAQNPGKAAASGGLLLAGLLAWWLVRRGKA